MKESILICERKVGTMLLRGFRIQDHYLMAVWDLGHDQPSPKRLVFDSFDDLNRTWLGFPALDEAGLRQDLINRAEGMQPRLPRIIRKPPGSGERSERPYRPPQERTYQDRSYGDRPYRTGGGFERENEAPRERPRIERPRRANPES